MKLAVFAIVALVSCSGGGGESSKPSAYTPYDYSGHWEGTTGGGLTFTMDVTVSPIIPWMYVGPGAVAGAPCTSGLTASFDGDPPNDPDPKAVTFDIYDPTAQSICQLEFSGTRQGTTISGTVSVSNCACIAVSLKDTFTVTKVASAPNPGGSPRVTLTREASGDLEVFMLRVDPRRRSTPNASAPNHDRSADREQRFRSDARQRQ